MRILKWLLVLIVALVALPPLWFKLFPEPASALPEPGRAVAVVGEQSINVLDRGRGPVVVLVHGLPGSAYDWRELTPRLNAAGLRTIAYDRVGYGHSAERRGDRFTLQENVNELRSLLSVLDLRDVTLVGWSYGGAMTMQAAPDPRIARLVLVGTGGPSAADEVPPEPPAAMQLMYSEPVLAWRAAVPPLSRLLQSALSDQAFSGGEQPDWWLPDLASNFSRWHTVMTFRNEVLAPIAADGFDPARISKPTLIVHAEDDRLAPVTIGRYLASVIPGAIYREVPGASHMLPVTHSEMLAGAIAEFALTPSP